MKDLKNVYVVENFGTFRNLFYSLKYAKQFVKEEGTDENAKPYYQIFKCDIVFNNVIKKF